MNPSSTQPSIANLPDRRSRGPGHSGMHWTIEGQAHAAHLLCGADHRPDRVDPAQLRRGIARGMRDRDRQLAALPAVHGPSARGGWRAARAAGLFTAVMTRVRAGTVDVRARGAAHGSPRTAAAARGRRPGRHRGSALAGVRAARRALAGGELGAASSRHPGALALWTQRIDPGALLARAQSLGQFMARHLLIILFTILVLFFLYQEGESLAQGAQAGAASPHRRAGRRLTSTSPRGRCAPP